MIDINIGFVSKDIVEKVNVTTPQTPGQENATYLYVQYTTPSCLAAKSENQKSFICPSHVYWHSVHIYEFMHIRVS